MGIASSGNGLLVCTNVRFKAIPDRKEVTLMPLIASPVEDSSVIMSDEWKGHGAFEANGYVHYSQ